MKFFVDENVSRRITERLERGGHVIIYGQDVAHGAQDVDVLALALAQSAIVLTEDTNFGVGRCEQRSRAANALEIRVCADHQPQGYRFESCPRSLFYTPAQAANPLAAWVFVDLP